MAFPLYYIRNIKLTFQKYDTKQKEIKYFLAKTCTDFLSRTDYLWQQKGIVRKACLMAKRNIFNHKININYNHNENHKTFLK